MVSGWTLPGLLSAEPFSAVMESNGGQEVQWKIRAFQSLLLRPKLGFWLEISAVVNRSALISLSRILTLRFFRRSDRWSSDVFSPC